MSSRMLSILWMSQSQAIAGTISPELRRANISGSDVDVSETKRRAKEAIEEDRKIAKQYEEYLASQGERQHAAAG